MKDLTIYPRLEKVGRIPEPGYVLGKKQSHPVRWADRLAEAKRFTDAELAAEAYRQMVRATAGIGLVLSEDGEISPADAVADIDDLSENTLRLGVIKRFAVSPHYYEEQE